MMMREKLDANWHKARVAARIGLKAKQGKSLSPRQKRWAGILGSDPEVPEELIQNELGPLEVDRMARAGAERRRLTDEPSWLNRPATRGSESSPSRYETQK